ncbi:MAG: permease, partial [Coriobacteriia bacterium]
MKRVLGWMRDEALFVVAAGLYIWALIVSPDKALQALAVAGQTLLGVLPIIAAVFAALGLFNVWVDKKRIAALLGRGGGLKAVVVASLAGTILVGPVYVIFPLMKAVREHGARWAVVGAVLAAWAVKVPMIPMEIGMLGWRFSVARIVFVALAAVPLGYLLEWIMDVGRNEAIEPL